MFFSINSLYLGLLLKEIYQYLLLSILILIPTEAFGGNFTLEFVMTESRKPSLLNVLKTGIISLGLRLPLEQSSGESYEKPT